MSNLAYEVILQGYDGTTDATDDLILWGLADCMEDVKQEYPTAQFHCLLDNFTTNFHVEWDFDLRKDIK